MKYFSFSASLFSYLLFITLLTPVSALAVGPKVVKGKGLQKGASSELASKRRRSVDIDLTSLKGSPSDIGKSQKIEMDLFDGLNLQITVTLKEVKGPDRFVWTGSVDGHESTVLMARNKNKLSISITMGERHFEINPSKDGYFVEEFDVNKFPDSKNDEVLDEHDTNPSGSVEPSIGTTEADVTNTVDILIAFDQAVVDAMGGYDAIVAEADKYIASFNMATSASTVNSQLRLVNVMTVPFTTSGDSSKDLASLKSTSDGFMDDVPKVREKYGADIVTLIASGIGGGCGVASKPGEYNIVVRSCALSNMSFTHEVGHNYGAGHDAQNGTAIITYGFGWHFTGLNGVLYRTVMGYNISGTPSKVRINQFSNPRILYQGVATGDAAVADNARLLNERAAATARLRATVVPPPKMLAPTNLSIR